MTQQVHTTAFTTPDPIRTAMQRLHAWVEDTLEREAKAAVHPHPDAPHPRVRVVQLSHAVARDAVVMGSTHTTITGLMVTEVEHY